MGCLHAHSTASAQAPNDSSLSTFILTSRRLGGFVFTCQLVDKRI